MPINADRASALKLYSPGPSESEPGGPGSLAAFFVQQPWTAGERPLALRTVDRMRDAVRHWQALAGDPPWQQLDQQSARDFVARLVSQAGGEGRPLSPATIHTLVYHLRTILRAAVEAGLLDSVPDFGRLPKKPLRRPRRALGIDELERILASVDRALAPSALSPDERRTWWRALLCLLWNLGLRIGEALGLRWCDWSADRQRLRVYSPKVHLVRDVELPPAVADWLDRLRPVTGRWPLVFAAPVRRPRGGQCFHAPFYLLRNYQWIRREAGLPGAENGTHAIRRRLATDLARINAAAASIALGHADPRTLVYYQQHDDLRRALADRPQPRLPAEAGGQRMFSFAD